MSTADFCRLVRRPMSVILLPLLLLADARLLDELFEDAESGRRILVLGSAGLGFCALLVSAAVRREAHRPGFVLMGAAGLSTAVLLGLDSVDAWARFLLWAVILPALVVAGACFIAVAESAQHRAHSRL